MKLLKKKNEKLTEKKPGNCGSIGNETTNSVSETEENNFLDSFEHKNNKKFQKYYIYIKKTLSKEQKNLNVHEITKNLIKNGNFYNYAYNINKNSNPPQPPGKKPAPYNPQVVQDTSNLSPAERLELARKTRLLQIQHYQEYEKKNRFVDKKRTQSTAKTNKGSAKVQFNQKIMLLEAASRGDAQEVELILKKGTSPNITNDDGLTALHQACIDNNVEIVKVLLKNRAHVNAIDKEAWTPLHAAATCGHAQIAQILIENNANLLAMNDDGNMPYDICEHPDTLNIIEKEMFSKGITQEHVDKTRSLREKKLLDELKEELRIRKKLPRFIGSSQETLLHISCAYGYTEVTNFLLANKALITAVDKDKWQPIHCAVYWGHTNLIEALLRNGADLNAKTKTGENCFDLCPNEEIKQQLLDMKEEIMKKGVRGINYSFSMGSRGGHSLQRLSNREKTTLTHKDQKSEGAHLKKIYADNDQDFVKGPVASSSIPGANKGMRTTENRVRRRSSTNLFREDMNTQDKKCIIS